MRMRNLWVLGIAAFALLAVGSATAVSERSSAQVLRVAIGAEPPSLDPGLATDTTSSNVLNQIMDPLVRLGPPPALAPRPELARSWTVKGTQVTINLRRNGRWTNGAPVTAHDFVWSWLRTISPQLGADYAYQFFGIKGAAEYNGCDPENGDCNALRAKVGIVAPNRWTIRITLTSPQPWFIQQLAHTSFLPVHKGTIDKHGDKWTEPGNIVTNGPFRLAAWRHNASLSLAKNSGWRNARSIKLDRVEIQIIEDEATALNAFRAGRIDVHDAGFNTADIPALKKSPEWRVFSLVGTYYYGFNVKAIPDVNQRRAMAAVIDRKAITRFITQAGQIPATTFTPTRIAGADVINRDAFLPTVHDDKKAREYLAKVRNVKRDVTLFYNAVSAHAKIATAIQAYWKSLGLNVTLRQMEWKQYLEFLGPPPNASVDVYRLGWIYDYPDAMNGLELWTCDSGNNNTNWCNRRYDALVKQARATPDAAKRYELYRRAEAILTGPNGDLPILPIYHYVQTALVRKNVQGYFTSPMGQTHLWDVSIS